MKTYRELLGNVLNDTRYRESVEWTNTWIDSANNSTPPQRKRLVVSYVY